jgi:DNA-binding NarL/FixJ family response regulator
MIKVLIADDHQLIIDGIKTTLADVPDIKIVAEANHGLEVLKELETKSVDIILMDINMPHLDGLECTKRVIEKFPGSRVIALSQFGEPRFVKRMIKNGASGYLLKDADKVELVNAIRLVNSGEKYFCDNVQISCSEPKSLEQSKTVDFPKLTTREIEIITLISYEYSTAEIANKLSITENTVEKHRTNLFEKTGLKNQAGLVRWALENSLIN